MLAFVKRSGVCDAQNINSGSYYGKRAHDRIQVDAPAYNFLIFINPILRSSVISEWVTQTGFFLKVNLYTSSLIFKDA